MLKNLKNWLGFNSVESQVEAMLEEIKTSAKKAPAKKAPAKKTSGGGKGKAAL